MSRPTLDECLATICPQCEETAGEIVDLFRRAILAEREACAATAGHQAVFGDGRDPNPSYDKGWADGARAAAAAIRARGVRP